VASPPPDGSRGCMGTILRPVGGVGHIVPCARARQAAQTALQANSGAHESSHTKLTVVDSSYSDSSIS
jgi:hypothetical protein